jgi:elongation factor P
MGRGGATDKFKVKDIVTGKVNNFTYNAGSVLEQAEVNTNRAVYLYNTGDTYTFMENDTGETYDINAETIEDITGYLKDNMDCYLTVYEGNVI